jgi:mitogen-activated protein kinase kinase
LNFGANPPSQAIVEGTPPDLPETGYSDTARHFVRSCLKKTPKLRPSYAALLQHQWLAPLAKPAIIPEESDDEADAYASPALAVHNGSSSGSSSDPASTPMGSGSTPSPNVEAAAPPPPADHQQSAQPGEHDELRLPQGVVDAEVATWVLRALDRRRRGYVGRAAKPALHAAPLDAVVTPGARVESAGQVAPT